jgi:glycosyltransferase involved in cell wall biosynthesis
VVKGQIEALESRGHEVKLFARYTDLEEQGRTYGLRSAFRVITGFGFNFKKEIGQFAPDLIIVHNLFPNISTRWLEDVTAKRIIFLHNFRPWCSNGFMLRGGKSCQKCLKNPLWGSIYRCANGSFLRSFIQSLGQVFNYHLKRLENSGAKIVTVSNMTKQKISEFSNLENVGALSNFISMPNNSNSFINNKGAELGEKFVWAGRISPEKGLEELLNIWPSTFALDIFGVGSDLLRLRKIHGGKKSISFKGAISNEDLRAELPHYRGYVNSSTWTEFGPMTIIEALSAGLPIIFPIGLSLGELISDYGAGNSYALNNSKSLELSLLKISDSELYEGYRQAAINLYEQEFSAEGWYIKLMNIFTNF